VSKSGLKWHLKERRIASKYRKIIFATEPFNETSVFLPFSPWF
jgi:hypothetical protein